MNQLLIAGANTGAITMTSRELLEFVNEARSHYRESAVRHNDFLARCRDELDGEPYEIFVEPAEGRTPAFEAIRMTADQCKLVAMRESKGVRRRVLARLNELEAKVTPALPDFSNPAAAARAWAEQYEISQAAAAKLAIAAPKVEALDRISKADGELCISDAAKAMQIQPRKLFAWMEQNHWIFRRGNKWVAYQDRIQSGYLTHRVTLVERKDGTDKEVAQVLVTAKGQAKLAEVAA